MHGRSSGLLLVMAIVCLLASLACSPPESELVEDRGKEGSTEGARDKSKDAANEDRPFLAIWRDNDGFASKSDSKAPYLRIAIWEDGRILFAKDPTEWKQELLEGRIEADHIVELKKAVERTGVFELKGTCYLVPDAPTDCIMVVIGKQEQMLYWDEVESPNYGINSNPKPQHLRFISSWKEVNKLALAAVPKESQPYEKRFQRPPKSWRPKEAIQSE